MAMTLRRRGHTWPEIDGCTMAHFKMELMVINDPDYTPKEQKKDRIIGPDDTEEVDFNAFFNC